MVKAVGMEPSGGNRLWFPYALLEQGWSPDVLVSIEHGRICRLESGVPAGDAEVQKGVAIPGMPNVHSHAFQRGMAGLTEVRGPGSDSFWTWREVMYRFVRKITPDDLEAIAALAYVEMLERGFTRVGEFHYLHHGLDGEAFGNPGEMAARIAAAAETAGIGLTLLPVFYAHAGFGGQDPAEGQLRFVNDLDGFSRLLDASRQALSGLEGAVLGLAPHSLRAVTADELTHLVALAADGPLHIHIAEQMQEVEDCIRWSGQRPVEWLLARHDLSPQWCLVHATHISGTELSEVVGCGAVVGLCPITEANLGDGLFPAQEFISTGGRFGIGSDSNVLISVTEELRTLEYGQRLIHRSRNLLSGGPGRSTGATLHSAALAGGTLALGATSGLAVDAWADIVALDLDHPSLCGRAAEAVLDSWIFAGNPNPIQTVWRAGRKVVSDGRHRHREQVVARYRAALKGILL